MNATIPQTPALNQDKIVWLACQIWQTEDGLADRKQEYWQKAEQFLAGSQPEQVRQARSSK